MTDEEHEHPARAISAAIRNRNASQIHASVEEFAEFCFKEYSPDLDPFPEEVFGLILECMSDNTFLGMSGSYQLLMLFEYDWARLSESQRDRLLEALRESYEKYRDWMSQFVISEILGEYYCDERALHVLIDLQQTSNETARALVPHGFEHVARQGGSDRLGEIARTQLLSMARDPSAKVQNEVAVALSNIGES